MANTRAKFGYLNYEKMINNLTNETDPKRKLDPYDINFTPDTHECYVIAPDLTPWSIKSKVYVFNDVESAISQLNKNTDTYAGQIVAIKHEEKYYGYIVNPASGGWSVSSLAEHVGKINYNELGNRPIKNIYGEIGKPVIISELLDGIYVVNGQYKISSTLETVYSSTANDMFVVSISNGAIYIKKITGKEIVNYIISGNDYQESSVLTSDYLVSNGYMTNDDFDQKIIALDLVKRNELETYVEEIIGNNLEPIIDEKVNAAIDSRIIEVSDSDIEALF